MEAKRGSPKKREQSAAATLSTGDPEKGGSEPARAAEVCFCCCDNRPRIVCARARKPLYYSCLIQRRLFSHTQQNKKQSVTLATRQELLAKLASPRQTHAVASSGAAKVRLCFARVYSSHKMLVGVVGSLIFISPHTHNNDLKHATHTHRRPRRPKAPKRRTPVVEAAAGSASPARKRIRGQRPWPRRSSKTLL
jgi:hypothetical protein